MNRLDKCLTFLLRPDIEGGFVNDPVDRGGATNHGITQRVYSAWLKAKGWPDASVANIKDPEVRAIYEDQYWEPLQCDGFEEPLDLVLFDTAVNHGVGRAVKLLQTAMQMTASGVLDTATVAQAQADPAKTLAADVMEARANFYCNIIANAPSQKRFAGGWANRLDALKVEAGL